MVRTKSSIRKHVEALAEREPAFARASTDRFFLFIDATDARFNRDETWKFLEGLHPLGVSEVAP